MNVSEGDVLSDVFGGVFIDEFSFFGQRFPCEECSIQTFGPRASVPPRGNAVLWKHSVISGGEQAKQTKVKPV
mgnify:CR=1 FL=1